MRIIIIIIKIEVDGNLSTHGFLNACMHGHTDGRKNQKQMPPAHLMDELRNENRPPHLGIPWNNWSLLPIKCTQLKSTDFSLGKSITHGHTWFV